LDAGHSFADHPSSCSVHASLNERAMNEGSNQPSFIAIVGRNRGMVRGHSRSTKSSNEDSPRTTSRRDNKRVRLAARIGLGASLVGLAFWMSLDFVAPLSWAVVIALTVWPAYRKFSAGISAEPSDVLAPLSFTLIIGLALFLPVGLAIHQAAQEGQNLLQSLAHVRENGLPVPEWLQQMPFGEHGARWWTANLSDPRSATELLGGNLDKEAQAAWTRTLGGQVLHRMFLFVLALISLFIILQNGAWIGNRVLDTADKILGDPGERLASKMVETVRGTVNGTVVVAVAEGVIIGSAYLVAGVPNPLLFALLTIAFAMIPLGAWVVFTSAALLLVVQGGSVFAATAVFFFGAFVMVIGDMFVWPNLVGNQARLPFLAALIGIFGGLQTFGLIGLFVGPMILGALWIVWREWLLRSPSEDGD
jgi:predicted PurR-regulated permease PerM